VPKKTPDLSFDSSFLCNSVFAFAVLIYASTSAAFSGVVKSLIKAFSGAIAI
jgi:hypothetical protein